MSPRSASGNGCTGYDNDGSDKVYKVTMANGQTLTATITPVTGFDPSLYLLPGPTCAAVSTTCLAGSDLASGTAETVT